jgi:hypothetical protein
VARVQRCNSIAQVQRRRSNQQVFKSYAYTASRLLALNLAGELSDLERDRVHRHVAAQFLSECSTTRTVGIALSAVNTMSKFDDGNGRESGFRLTVSVPHSVEDLPHTLTAALGCYQDAGVKNYSHAERSRGLRLLMISLRSAAKSGSIVGS